MKKLIALLVATVAMSVNAYAVTVQVNNEPIDTEAVIVDGRTLVPVRGVFEALNYEVSWDGATKTATLTNGENTVVITSGMTTFTVNDMVVTPEVPQQIVEGRFMLPLRAVGEAVGAEFEWDAATKTVNINKKQGLKIADIYDAEKGVVISSDGVNDISY